MYFFTYIAEVVSAACTDVCRMPLWTLAPPLPHISHRSHRGGGFFCAPPQPRACAGCTRIFAYGFLYGVYPLSGGAVGVNFYAALWLAAFYLRSGSTFYTVYIDQSFHP